MRGEARCLAGDLVVEIDDVTESKGPEIASIDHDHPTGADGVFDSILGHTIVVMPAYATMLDPFIL
jgi:hypothetical protein